MITTRDQTGRRNQLINHWWDSASTSSAVSIPAFIILALRLCNLFHLFSMSTDRTLSLEHCCRVGNVKLLFDWQRAVIRIYFETAGEFRLVFMGRKVSEFLSKHPAFKAGKNGFSGELFLSYIIIYLLSCLLFVSFLFSLLQSWILSYSERLEEWSNHKNKKTCMPITGRGGEKTEKRDAKINKKGK